MGPLNKHAVNIRLSSLRIRAHLSWRCFPVLQLRCALILRELNRIFIAYLFKGSQEQSVFLQTPLFTAFLVTVLKNLTYALVSTSSEKCSPDCSKGFKNFQ